MMFLKFVATVDSIGTILMKSVSQLCHILIGGPEKASEQM